MKCNCEDEGREWPVESEGQRSNACTDFCQNETYTDSLCFFCGHVESCHPTTNKAECVACRVRLETGKQCEICEAEAPFTVWAWEKATNPQVVLAMEKRIAVLEDENKELWKALSGLSSLLTETTVFTRVMAKRLMALEKIIEEWTGEK